MVNATQGHTEEKHSGAFQGFSNESGHVFLYFWATEDLNDL